jgi:hypothetical protein
VSTLRNDPTGWHRPVGLIRPQAVTRRGRCCPASVTSGRVRQPSHLCCRSALASSCLAMSHRGLWQLRLRPASGEAVKLSEIAVIEKPADHVRRDQLGGERVKLVPGRTKAKRPEVLTLDEIVRLCAAVNKVAAKGVFLRGRGGVFPEPANLVQLNPCCSANPSGLNEFPFT